MTNYSLSCLGMVNALGNNLDDIAKHLFRGDTHRLKPHALLTVDKTVPVGEVREPLKTLPSNLSEFQCRNHALVYDAYLQIEDQIKRQCALFGHHRVGVVVGSSTSGIDGSERAYFNWRERGDVPKNYSYPHQHEMGSIAALIKELGGLGGPAYTLSTACSSSGKVFAAARGLLDLGLCDAVVTGGGDTLCDLTVNGFDALGALSTEVSNPMSRNRDGLNIGEGAALFILTREKGPIRLCGIGESSDAHHISAPHPDGIGAEESMVQALADAHLSPGHIDYLNLHGTGTKLNDAMESKAVSRVFGDLPCSSTKPTTGHCLGAAGAIEAGFCWLALDRQKDGGCPLPPHPWDNQPDRALPTLELARRGARIQSDNTIYFMSNSFAFGGSNCSVVLARHPEEY